MKKEIEPYSLWWLPAGKDNRYYLFPDDYYDHVPWFTWGENLKQFKAHNKEIKIAIIHDSIKRLKRNYYNSRSKKVENLIKNIEKSSFKKSMLGGCIFVLNKGYLCLKAEKT